MMDGTINKILCTSHIFWNNEINLFNMKLVAGINANGNNATRSFEWMWEMVTHRNESSSVRNNVNGRIVSCCFSLQDNIKEAVFHFDSLLVKDEWYAYCVMILRIGGKCIKETMYVEQRRHTWIPPTNVGGQRASIGIAIARIPGMNLRRERIQLLTPRRGVSSLCLMSLKFKFVVIISIQTKTM